MFVSPLSLSSLSLLLLLFGGGVVYGKTLEIKDVDGLIEFSESVNSGTTYEGTTVVLTTDIVFDESSSWQFKPIGKDQTNNFQGSFDGKGHVISNLMVNSSLQNLGLFGYLDGGITIKNVVLDASCSVEGISDTDIYMGGIIGWYYTNKGAAAIENCVNMASVLYKEGESSSIAIGGIAGAISASSYEITVKNCANYGNVANHGTNNGGYIGGIVGYSGGSYSKRIQNCLNYGTEFSLATSKLRMGGIVGNSQDTVISNCLSAGKITLPEGIIVSGVGGIVGYVTSPYSSTTTIEHCRWTTDTSRSSSYGYKDTKRHSDRNKHHPNRSSRRSLGRPEHPSLQERVEPVVYAQSERGNHQRSGTG